MLQMGVRKQKISDQEAKTFNVISFTVLKRTGPVRREVSGRAGSGGRVVGVELS